MRRGLFLPVLLLLTVLLPAVAQQTSRANAAVLSGGTFVGHRPGTQRLAETVTLRFVWNGIPVLGTYRVRAEDRWSVLGSTVNWDQIPVGTRLTVPGSAPLRDLSFGGMVGAGTVAGYNTINDTIRVRLPEGEVRTLRVAPDAFFVRDERLTPLDAVRVGEVVLFEIAPNQNQIGILITAGPLTRAVITRLGDENVTLRFTEGGRAVTRTFSLEEDTHFFQKGEALLIEDFPDDLQVNETLWMLGPTNAPRYVLANPTQGFAVADISGTSGVPPATGTMPAPLNAGRFVSYTAATNQYRAQVTLQFTWRNRPLLGVFAATDENSWRVGNTPVRFARLQPGTLVTVPASAQLLDLSLQGQVGFGTITALDRTGKTFTVRIPNGALHTVRFDPQALFMAEGKLVALSELREGDTVRFEVGPQQNAVSLFVLTLPGIRARVTQVSTKALTVRYVEDGQVLTRTYQLSPQLPFYSQGRRVTASNIRTLCRVGEIVWIYGDVQAPQFIACGVEIGYTAALVR